VPVVLQPETRKQTAIAYEKTPQGFLPLGVCITAFDAAAILHTGSQARQDVSAFFGVSTPSFHACAPNKSIFWIQIFVKVMWLHRASQRACYPYRPIFKKHEHFFCPPDLEAMTRRFRRSLTPI
jgi:hypothetical protein